jgi:hypothetical protein
MTRKLYPSYVNEEEWDFVAPYLALNDEQAPSGVTACAKCSTNCAGWPGSGV